MPSIFYVKPEPQSSPLRSLVSNNGGAADRVPFHGQLEIGRHSPGRTPMPGELLIDDPTISRQHCYVTQTPDGRCWVRDVSRNGTRIDGRRLVPNLEHEIQTGQRLGVGDHHEFELSGAQDLVAAPGADGQAATVAQPGTTVATVLVGDIRDYTVMVRQASADQLQGSVSGVFDLLSEGVVELGGTVKEYQGDALFAFWEKADDPRQVAAACGAALELDRRARRLARDADIWSVDGFPLEIDWALSTGMVVIDSFGGNHPTGLSMIGEPVVKAFRLEKFADDSSGRILACEATQMVASESFEFRDLGKMQAKGFDKPDRVFALLDTVAGGEQDSDLGNLTLSNVWRPGE